MKKLIQVLVFLCIVNANSQPKKDSVLLRNFKKNHIYIQINGTKTTNVFIKRKMFDLKGYNFSAILDPENIATINVYKADEAKKLFGIENDIMDFTFKNKSEFMKIDEFMKTINSERKPFLVVGRVTDCENTELAGVNIKNLNTNESVLSNFEGYYKIYASKYEELQFEYVTEITLTRQILSKDSINVKMKKTNTVRDITIKKPVIYLYPTTETLVDYQFKFKGKLETTFPKYDKNWLVKAYPDGKIYDTKTKRFYTSLFWDGVSEPKENIDYKEGFVVQKENLTSFLIEKLEQIGLSNNETNDFVQFWLPILEKNQTNFIHFLTGKEYDKIATNNITPKPDTEIRVFMEFYKMNIDKLDKIKIPKPQTFEQTIRKGFTVVEWGGSDITKTNQSLKKEISEILK